MPSNTNAKQCQAMLRLSNANGKLRLRFKEGLRLQYLLIKNFIVDCFPSYYNSAALRLKAGCAKGKDQFQKFDSSLFFLNKYKMSNFSLHLFSLCKKFVDFYIPH